MCSGDGEGEMNIDVANWSLWTQALMPLSSVDYTNIVMNSKVTFR